MAETPPSLQPDINNEWVPQVPPRLKKPEDQAAEPTYPDNDDMEEEISAQMTQSYSEISFKSDPSPGEEDISLPGSSTVPLAEQIMQRPATLAYDRNFTPNKPSNLEGTFHREGNMTHYVTDNLEYKIKLSSPVSKKSDGNSMSSKGSTPMSLHRRNVFPQMGLPNVGLLQDLEYEAQSMATSIDALTENLCEILQSISSLTAQNVDIYKDAVTKMSEAMDSNIKSMYTMMAKAEEVSKAMKNVQGYAQRIKDIRRLVDLFESYL
ncbi:BLOC-1-related complex subunit 6 [Coccinella septempunctata]|uniref:BLOC-1-related complex subunit 6 n=1 Tax=Coccinella septempunctata TaxID=41139 RepID=UPI001D05FC2F|nr:BLOC-1-related complex subunit 6 [Coccinella septempunctata]XP_044762964.1 BLOC-1-related complex subunit 6 [Coccinella septempunctata]